jgi:hypothetical protein
VLSPGVADPATHLIRGEDGRITAANQVQLGDLLSLGAEANDAVIMEFDLSGYLDGLVDASLIQQAVLALDTSVSFPRLQTDSTLTYVNNVIFFKAQDQRNQFGAELWKTDGSVQGLTS